ncbi:MAG: glycoside hydrolase family 2 protein [Cytophagaceae bacterium]
MKYTNSLARLYILAFLLLSGISAAAQNSSMIGNIEGRKTMSLNGKWAVIVDPYENGFYNYRYEENNNGYFRNYEPKDKSELVEYKFDNARTLHVPGDWNSQREDLKLYEGTIWYKFSFDYPVQKDTRLFLHFGAANYETYVYLNGEKLGRHIGGFTPFQFEVTGRVKEKGNFVVVKVDNKRYKEAIPTVNTDWWNYGGITRDVNLVELPSAFIQDYTVQLRKKSLNEISASVKLSNKISQKVTIEIPEAKVLKEATTDTSGSVQFTFKANLNLWSPENPKLYKVIISSGKDSVEELIGFRCIETEGENILLNKKPVFLKGICIHEEIASAERRAYSMEDAQRLLGAAKELGCNYVRLAHYPHNENMTRLADKLGLMVWSEIPLYWTIQWENPVTIENARNQLTEMIIRDKNRVSVVLWSVANETPLKESRTLFLKNLIDLARKLDDTRLITAALEVHNETKFTKILDDPLGQYLDVLGCNEYIGWYDDYKTPDIENFSWQSAYGKPLIISELGADCLYGHHGEATEKFTEEYQEQFFIHQVNMLKKITFLRGVSPWILTDFRSPRRPLPYIQDYWNRKGLISERGEKKRAYFILKRYYEGLK